MNKRIIDRRAVLLASGSLAMIATAPSVNVHAQAINPTRIVVPFPAGGPTDALARIVADELKDDLGRAVIVENKPGASGAIGTRYVLNAPADGSVWLVGNIQTHATAPFLIKDAGYDPVADFRPAAGLVDMHHVLIVRKDLGTADVAALIARAKEQPGKLNFGSTGIGSGSHLSMENFMMRTGTRMQHVPFQGAAQMAGEIAAGRLDLALAVLPTVTGPIESQQVTALAVAGKERAPQVPAVPTLSEQGVKDAEAESWLALFAAKGVERAMVDDIGQRVRARMARPDVRARIEKLGLTVSPRDGVAFAAFQQSEIKRWGDVIKTVGLKPE